MAGVRSRAGSRWSRFWARVSVAAAVGAGAAGTLLRWVMAGKTQSPHNISAPRAWIFAEMIGFGQLIAVDMTYDKKLMNFCTGGAGIDGGGSEVASLLCRCRCADCLETG